MWRVRFVTMQTALLSLVTDIIQLSELDHRELPRKFEQLDLFSVTRECVKEHDLIASQEKHQIDL